MSTPHQVTVQAPLGLEAGPLILRCFGRTARLYALPLEEGSLEWLRGAHPHELSGLFLLLDTPLGEAPTSLGVGGGFQCERRLQEVMEEESTDPWRRVIVLTNEDESFTLPQIRYLEARLTELARVPAQSLSGNYLVDPAAIGERERAEMEEYLECARGVLLLLGVRLQEAESLAVEA